MLRRWGSFVFNHRKLVLGISGFSLVLAIVSMITIAPGLTSGGFVSDDAESSRVDQQLVDEFGRGNQSVIYIFDAEVPIDTPAVRAAIEAAVAPLAADPIVQRVLTPWSGGSPGFISTDGESAYTVALLDATAEEAEEALPHLRQVVEEAAAPAGLEVTITGNAAIFHEIQTEVEEGIFRAEAVAIPLTILIQILIFGSLVAAGLPLFVGGLAIVASLAVILALSSVSFQSIFSINIIIMLGMALGVDYSLFMVARYREELKQRPPSEALPVTMATVGKAILFSGITVIFGLAATRFFAIPALTSMGLAGMAVVAMALVFGLTFLPAMLAVLGYRVNAVPIRLPARLTGNQEGRFWHGVAMTVMRRPVAILLPVLAILLLAGVPFLRLDITPGGADVLPTSSPARAAYDRLQTNFPVGESDPVPVIVTVDDGDPESAASIAALERFVAAAAQVPHVSRVESLIEPPYGAPDDLISGSKTLVQVVADAEGPALEEVVRDLRGIEVSGLTAQVGGDAAEAVDTVDGIRSGMLPAFLFVVVGSYLILLLTFGSVFLPLKAILMTLLSISASLGALVLVFQDGRFENLLGFTASGEIISTTPILMFCILFGLSMDYEVLMLSRIQEEYQRTGNNTLAVATGLERTAKVITGAAAIMIVAFGAFMLADIVIIKSMGFGLALAVLIDATIVRAILVPATMRLMGNWNWWAPRPVKTIVERLGLGHAEPMAVPVATGD
jgi:uncharacterized membrane protein YdfJ with MMPL/SSD domain